MLQSLRSEDGRKFFVAIICRDSFVGVALTVYGLVVVAVGYMAIAVFPALLYHHLR